MARVEFDSVEKSFGDTDVVKGVSIDITDGEFLVLVGPSGCGKSTCLRMIAGLESVSAGEIRIDGRVVNDVAPKDRNIGMVFQSYALYPHMTVRQNLGFGLSLQKVAAATIESRINEVARSLELESLLDRKPKQLSGGQRQRVAIGRAIVKQPKVFLFDEPLSNLDAALRVQMRAEIARLHQQVNTTMVYVTHDQVEAMMLADRIAVLDAGIVQQIGSPLELYERPANKFVAGFIGSPSMNFLPASLAGENRVEVAAVTLDTPGLEAATNAPLTLGIRPQDVVLGHGELDGQVTLVELLGWEAFVHCETDAGTVVARVSGSEGTNLRVGTSVKLTLPSLRSHIFASTGESLWCGAATA